ncbi:HAD family hydrolase [Clostridium chromiireducens]|uniref:Phosphorylated carbohydrates phosphatase n=1 Tax=Clostridium chromiireducens TaxID=225345 RepID=A0A1V4IQZ9_9CLOT|nr:HAD family phosphatase [Clostridium chromiireducens]OPJ62309.1 phosphorylated carbohydrates phosphatase [Clostridium chromiireducens]
MKKIDAVLFDMDGVIFDTENVYLDIWTKVFEKYGYTMTLDVYISVMGTGRENVIKTFLEIYGEDLPIGEMYIEKDKKLEKVIKNGLVPTKQGAKEILNYFKQKNYKIALATAAKRDRVARQLKMADMIDIFDDIVCGDDIKFGKPNPEIFLKAAQKLSVDPGKCLVIEDSPAGIKAAFNAKMTGIHVEDLKKADEEILNYCYKSFKNLLEIQEYFNNLEI